MTLQVPVERDMHDSACMNSFSAHLAGLALPR